MITTTSDYSIELTTTGRPNEESNESNSLDDDYESDQCEPRKDEITSKEPPRKMFGLNRPSSYLKFLHKRPKQSSHILNLRNSLKQNSKDGRHTSNVSSMNRNRRPASPRQIIEFPIAIPIEPIPLIAKALEALPSPYSQMSSVSFPVFVPEKTLDHTYNYVKHRYVESPVLLSLDQSKNSLRDALSIPSITLPNFNSNAAQSLSSGWAPTTSFLNNQLTYSNNFTSPSYAQPHLHSQMHGSSGASFAATKLSTPSLPSYSSGLPISTFSPFNSYNTMPSRPDLSLSNSMSGLSTPSGDFYAPIPSDFLGPYPGPSPGLASDSLFGGLATSNSLYDNGLLGGSIGGADNSYPLYAYPMLSSTPSNNPLSASGTLYPNHRPGPPPIPFHQILPHLIQHSTGYRQSMADHTLQPNWHMLLADSGPSAFHHKPTNQSTESTSSLPTFASNHEDSNEFVLQVRPLDPREPSSSFSALSTESPVLPSSSVFSKHFFESSLRKSTPIRPKFIYRNLFDLSRTAKSVARSTPISHSFARPAAIVGSNRLLHSLQAGDLYSQLMPLLLAKKANKISPFSSLSMISNYTRIAAKSNFNLAPNRSELLDTGPTSIVTKTWKPLHLNSTKSQHFNETFIKQF